MKLKKEDRAKLAKALCGVLVWGAVVIGAGSAIGKTPVSHPTTVKSAAETRQAIQDGRGSEESKAQKLHELNLQAVINVADDDIREGSKDAISKNDNMYSIGYSQKFGHVTAGGEYTSITRYTR